MQVSAEAIQVEDVSLTYHGRVSVEALRGLSIHVSTGEFVAIVGPSGCGKTSLLKIVAGFVQQSGGRVKCFGREVAGIGTDRGMLFQDLYLFPWQTARENVAYPLRLKGLSKAEALREASAWLSDLDLAEFEHVYPSQLSAGMKQRVALARLFATKAPVYLLDEPFNALDSFARLASQRLLHQAWQTTHATALFVTHDPAEALFLADRIYVLSGRPGTVVDEFQVPFGRPRDVDHPELVRLRRRIFAGPESASASGQVPAWWMG